MWLDEKSNSRTLTLFVFPTWHSTTKQFGDEITFDILESFRISLSPFNSDFISRFISFPGREKSGPRSSFHAFAERNHLSRLCFGQRNEIGFLEEKRKKGKKTEWANYKHKLYIKK